MFSSGILGRLFLLFCFFCTSQTYKALSLGHACVIFALEQQSKIVKEMAAPVYSALVAKMAPRVCSLSGSKTVLLIIYCDKCYF